MEYFKPCKYDDYIDFISKLNSASIYNLDSKLANNNLFSQGATLGNCSVSSIAEHLSEAELAELDAINSLNLGFKKFDFVNNLHTVLNADESVSLKCDYFLTRKPFTSEIITNKTKNAHYEPFKIPKVTDVETLIDVGLALRSVGPSFYVAISSLFSQFSEKGAFSATDALIPADLARSVIEGHFSKQSKEAAYIISCLFLDLLSRTKVLATSHPNSKVSEINDLQNRELFLSLEGLFNIYCISICEGVVNNVLDLASTEITQSLKISQSDQKASHSHRVSSFSFVDTLQEIVAKVCDHLSSQLREVTHSFEYNKSILLTALKWAIVKEFRPKSGAYTRFTELSNIEQCPNVLKLAKSVNAVVGFLKDPTLPKLEFEHFKRAEKIASIIMRSDRVLMRDKRSLSELVVESSSRDGKLALVKILSKSSATAEIPLLETSNSTYYHLSKQKPRFSSLATTDPMEVLCLYRADPPAGSLMAIYGNISKEAEFITNVYPEDPLLGNFGYVEYQVHSNKYKEFLANLACMLYLPISIVNNSGSSFRIGFLLEKLPIVRGYYILPCSSYVCTGNREALALGVINHSSDFDIKLNDNNKLLGVDSRYKLFVSSDSKHLKKAPELRNFTLNLTIIDNPAFSSWFIDSAKKNSCIKACQSITFDERDFVNEAWFSHASLLKDSIAVNCLQNKIKVDILRLANSLNYLDACNTISDKLALSLRRTQPFQKVQGSSFELKKSMIVSKFLLNSWYPDSQKEMCKRKLMSVIQPFVANNEGYNFASTIEFKFYSEILSIGLIEYILLDDPLIGNHNLSRLNLYSLLGDDIEERFNALYTVYFLRGYDNENL